MKKIIIILPLTIIICVGLRAQSPQKGKIITVVEANRLNGTVQPAMKDGKPYSQWVAEEKAKMQAAKAVTPQAAKANNSMDDGYVPPAKTTEPVIVKKEDAQPAVVQLRPDHSATSNTGVDGAVAPVEKKQQGATRGEGFVKPADASKVKVQQPVKEEAVTAIPVGIRVEAAPVVTEVQKAAEKPVSSEPTGNSPKPVKSKTE